MSYFDIGADEQLIARSGYAGVDGLTDYLPTWSQVTGAVKSGAGAVLNAYGQQQQQAGASQAYQQVAMQAAAGRSGMPEWILPVAAIGGVGVVAFLLLKKGRK
jgi:hypothetical protein